MNDDFVLQFTDIQGKIISRTLLQRIRIVFFAAFKQFFDIFFALVGLLISSPILLVVAIAIKLDSKGPVLFKQERTGKFGKKFILYKFRSMVVENDVHDFKSQDKHTKVGKIIRKTSLDELPQLLNILKRDMSFIGPRPWIHDYYENMNETQKHRCDVRPGLTGLAQCNGRNDITIFDKINYDLTYIKNYSLKQDISIIFLTIKSVFSQKGADAGKSTIQQEINALKKQNNKKTKRVS